ncbi:MAG: hypothetical protein ACMUIU_07515 [bacterium]
MKQECFIKILFLFSVFIIVMSLISLSNMGDVYAYYGFPYTYSLAGLYNPMSLYGYGTGLLGGLTNLYGLGGIYNLTGGLGGLGLLGRLYGLGGLYGMGGLYGLGSSYGLSSLYGLGGLTAPNGVGGLYGLGSLYGLGGMYGLYGMAGLTGLGSLLTGLTTNPLSSLVTNNPVVAEQAGTWIGQWNLGFLFGTMIMNLKEDPLTGGLSGTVQLIGNNTFAGIFNVFGEGSLTFVLLTGQDPTLSYAISISAPLPTPTTMEGYYDIYKIPNTTPQESGTFALELVSTVVI